MPLNLWNAASAGLIIAMRSMALPAVISDQLARDEAHQADNDLFNLVARPEIATLLKVATVGEMVMDKMPFVPSRTDLFPLLGRMSVAGAFVAILSRPQNRVANTLVAIAAAGVGTHLAYQVRKQATERFDQPALKTAVAEDALVAVSALAWRDEFARQD